MSRDHSTPETRNAVNRPHPWWVYLLRCADGSLYAGSTADLTRRVRQHNGDITGGARYTRGRRPVVLVWSEPAVNRSEAVKRETALKRMDRCAKERLIERSQ